MKFKDIYALAIKSGMAADPRGQKGAEKVLAQAKKDYDKLAEDDKEFFDLEKLCNPYADTRMLTGDEDAEIGSILVGIDIELGELMLADALCRRGDKIDLIMAHHPEGPALVGLPDVMWLQTGSLAEVGVLPNRAEALMDDRARDVEINVTVSNYNRTVDAAKLLGFNMMCVHTPCDNLVNSFMTKLIESEQPETVDDVCKLIRTVPEYAAAARNGNPPMIVAGSGKRSAGKVFVDFTGGTGGPKEYIKLLSEAGISTVLCMHARKEVIDLAKENQINVVIAGHMPSDSVGLNLFLDKLEAAGVKITPTSGVIRVCRN